MVSSRLATPCVVAAVALVTVACGASSPSTPPSASPTSTRAAASPSPSVRTSPALGTAVPSASVPASPRLALSGQIVFEDVGENALYRWLQIHA